MTYLYQQDLTDADDLKPEAVRAVRGVIAVRTFSGLGTAYYIVVTDPTADPTEIVSGITALGMELVAQELGEGR